MPAQRRRSKDPLNFKETYEKTRKKKPFETRERLEGIWGKVDPSAGSVFYELEFLRGNFAKVLSDKRGMGMQDSLGWSSSFMKQGFALFYPYFLKWKALTPMERTDIAHALRRLEQMVELRVKGIMDANKRNYYGECAAFIAALGEVKESRGEELNIGFLFA